MRIQCAGEGVEQGNGGAIRSRVGGTIRSQQQEASGIEDRAWKKGVRKLGDLPSGKVEARDRGGVEQLDELGTRHSGTAHDFIEHDLPRRGG